MHNVTVYNVRPNIYLVPLVLLSVDYIRIADNATDTYVFCSDRLIIWVAW